MRCWSRSLEKWGYRHVMMTHPSLIRVVEQCIHHRLNVPGILESEKHDVGPVFPSATNAALNDPPLIRTLCNHRRSSFCKILALWVCRLIREYVMYCSGSFACWASIVLAGTYFHPSFDKEEGATGKVEGRMYPFPDFEMNVLSASSGYCPRISFSE